MIYNYFMPAHKKPENEKLSGASINVRVPKPLQAKAQAMAEATGVATSQLLREYLEKQVEKWEKSGGKTR